MVWRPLGSPRSDALIGALSKRDFRVQTTDSRHEALAIAAVAHRKHEALVLVMDRAPEIARRDRTLEAIERFAPGALLWVYDESANPPLRAFVEHQTKPAPRAPSVQTPPPRRGAPPGLRLTGSDRDEPVSSADILDQDELDALLGTDD